VKQCQPYRMPLSKGRWRWSNGITGRICLSVSLSAPGKAPSPNPKKPLAVRGCTARGCFHGGRYNFNNLQIEVESIE
jgi:hypothetical protein